MLRSADFPTMESNRFLLPPYLGPGLLPHAPTSWTGGRGVSAKRLDPAKPDDR